MDDEDETSSGTLVLPNRETLGAVIVTLDLHEGTAPGMTELAVVAMRRLEASDELGAVPSLLRHLAIDELVNALGDPTEVTCVRGIEELTGAVERLESDAHGQRWLLLALGALAAERAERADTDRDGEDYGAIAFLRLADALNLDLEILARVKVWGSTTNGRVPQGIASSFVGFPGLFDAVRSVHHVADDVSGTEASEPLTGRCSDQQHSALLSVIPAAKLPSSRPDSGRARMALHHGEARRLAFVFCGAGVPLSERCRSIIFHKGPFRSTVSACERALEPIADFSLMDAFIDGLESVDTNAKAQVLLLATQAGLLSLWNAWGIRPDLVIGHSIGELAAAYAAGILTLDEAIRLAWRQGSAIDQLAGQGRMLAVALPLRVVEEELPLIGGNLAIAADNGPHCCVVSGANADVERAAAYFLRRGAVSSDLLVPYASHSQAIDGVALQLLASFADTTPRRAHIPMVSTVTGSLVEGPECDAAYWLANHRGQVRFRSAVAAALSGGPLDFLEIGPDAVHRRDLLSIAESIQGDAIVVASFRHHLYAAETLRDARRELQAMGRGTTRTERERSVVPPPERSEERPLPASAHEIGSLSEIDAERRLASVLVELDSDS